MKIRNKHKTKKCDNLPFYLPKSWTCLKAEGPGPFVTKAILKNSEGEIVQWDSRNNRKHDFKFDTSVGSTWWAPGAIGWWIGVLFSIGSILFALGALPPYLKIVGHVPDAITFFIGSVFFTSAAFLQYFEEVNSYENLSKKKSKFKLFSFMPKRISWWSVVIQLIGTVSFNLTTFYAIFKNLSIHQLIDLVWVPDMYGSICFLIACFLAWIEVSHGLISWNSNSFSWNISGVNMLGSIFFGISAIGATVIPSTGLVLNTFLVNMGTFLGAICFLIGAILLLPERIREKIN
ncbi:MAG: hypothetical protein KO202_06845 [Methanobacteriaceae archaeon]|jgi:hypothetical protein|nr:hypothetical protein [Methanobacteriaceae archaeon]